MALAINQSTTGVQGAWDDLIYVIYDPLNTGELNYRYICQISYDLVELVTMKQLPNNAAACVFNIRGIVSNYVEQDDNPYYLGQYGVDGTTLDTTKIFGQNQDAIKKFSIVFGYEYSLTATTAPTQTLFPLQAVEVTCVNGSFMFPNSASPPTTESGTYQMSSSGKQFLSDIEPGGPTNTEMVTSILYSSSSTYVQKAALAFLNGDDVGSTGSDYLHVSYFDGATPLNTGYFRNTPSQGGVIPVAGLSDRKSLIYVGVGTFNLHSQAIDTSLRPGDAGNAGWTHYFVQMASSATLSGNEKSVSYKFERVSCGRFVQLDQVFSIHWWNSKGGIDSLPLLGKVTESQEVTKTDYRTSGGNSFSANGSGSNLYAKQSWQGGKRSANVQTTTSFDLSTIGGNPDQLTPMIRSLMSSSRVFLSGKSVFGWSTNRTENGLVQAYVKDTSMQYKSGVNDGPASYKVSVEISRRRPNS